MMVKHYQVGSLLLAGTFFFSITLKLLSDNTSDTSLLIGFILADDLPLTKYVTSTASALCEM